MWASCSEDANFFSKAGRAEDSEGYGRHKKVITYRGRVELNGGGLGLVKSSERSFEPSHASTSMCCAAYATTQPDLERKL